MQPSWIGASSNTCIVSRLAALLGLADLRIARLALPGTGVGPFLLVYADSPLQNARFLDRAADTTLTCLGLQVRCWCRSREMRDCLGRRMVDANGLAAIVGFACLGHGIVTAVEVLALFLLRVSCVVSNPVGHTWLRIKFFLPPGTPYLSNILRSASLSFYGYQWCL